MTQINDKLECVLDCRDKLGEGIFWCPVERALYCVDVPTPPYLHRWDPKGGDHETWPMPEMITSLAKRNDGTLLVASHHGLNVFDPRKATLVRVAAPETDRPGNRASDGGTARRGRFWFGTMHNNVAPDGTYLDVPESTGVLCKVEPGMRIVPMAGEVGISNAICWSPDDRTMYFADTLLGAIHTYDFDLELGAISNKRVFAKLDGHGYPDGATVDADGYLWNARWEGGSVVRFAPDGRVIPGSHRGLVFDHHYQGYFAGAIDPTTPGLDVHQAVAITRKAGSISLHHVRAVHGSKDNLSETGRPLLFFGYCAADSWPLRADSFKHLSSFNAKMVRGKPTLEPRFMRCAGPHALSPGPHQGSIFENQKVVKGRSFARTM